MDKSILTISSHVVHGYVGNKAIVFPLQCKGWEVDTINTVNFSNHTGYGIYKGSIINEDLLTELLKNQTSKNNSFLITGYLPSDKVVDIIIKHLETKREDQIYLLDPILGDEGQLYVDKSSVEKYQKLIIDSKIKIDIITPNKFELEILTGIKIENLKDLKLGIEYLHKYIKFVIITSYTIGGFIYCFVSVNNKIKAFQIPIIEGYFTGVGDLFTSLLIDRIYENYYRNKNDNSTDSTDNSEYELTCLAKSVNQVLSIMERILHKTYENGIANGGDSLSIGTLEIGKFELNLIQSKSLFNIEEEEFNILDIDDLYE